MTTARVLVSALLISVLFWETYLLIQRWVLGVMVVLMLVLSGCKVTLPTKPPIRICAPANSVYCIPNTHWGLT